MLVIADASKWVAQLGQYPLPIEIAPFGFEATRRAVEAAISVIQPCGPLTLRTATNGHPFVTDGGHWIIDAALSRIDDPNALAQKLSAVPGVMEHGLFVDMAAAVIIGESDGIRVVERS
jgi:ribose 5-phosphate isomerase A